MKLFDPASALSTRTSAIEEAAIIAMVILTTLVAPLLLRWAFREEEVVVEAVDLAGS